MGDLPSTLFAEKADREETGQIMLRWAKEIFDFPRSLTGEGVRKTLRYLRSISPHIQMKSYPSGLSVFDWTVPREWRVHEAYLEHVETGQRFAKFSDSPLHLVGYSVSVETEMSLASLKPRIFTSSAHPDWIPYVTSYYEPTWGFCMSERQKSELPEGDYRVVIDCDFFDGKMDFGEAVFQGTLDEEVFFSTYVCHPSMANNEASGPVLVTALMELLRARYPNPKYTYRFLLAPETIGSLAYLSENFEHMRANMRFGFNVSCVGDNRAFSRIETRLGNTHSDIALEAALIGAPAVKTYSFLERGSDERQYCSPGIDLPVAGYCRSKYGEYPEYHTSADDFNVVSAEGLQGSVEILACLIDALELGIYPKSTVLGEPQLSKRGLYPTTSHEGSGANIRTRMDVIAYSDGQHTIFDIARTILKPLHEVVVELKLLIEHELIQTNHHPW